MASPSKNPKLTASDRKSSTERSRTLIVHRDHNGYGLTLSGDQPVSVQTVKPKGAADRAGIRENDIIIKVNGQRVTEASHTEVVQLIQAGKYVALTVIQRSTSCGPPSPDTSTCSSPVPMARQTSGKGITAPQPANRPSGSSLTLSTSLLRRLSFGKTDSKPSPKIGRRRYSQGNEEETEAVRALTDEKLHTMQLMVEQEQRYVDQLRQDLAVNNSQKLQTELETAVKRLAKLKEQFDRAKGGTAPSRPLSMVLPVRPSPPPPTTPPRSLDGPPPLPARNKTLPLQSEIDTPPPLPPPRPPTSLPPLPLPPGGGEKKGSFDRPLPRRPAPNVPSPLAYPIHHERTRSSPSSLEEWGNPGNPPPGRISPRYETPPGTPPPPYMDQLSSTDPALVTWNNLTAGGIINMEDDEDSDGEASNVTREDEDHGPFNNLRDLLCHQAHLTVFLNYVISNSDPAPLLFFLISDTYKLGSVKDMQRWAYEIHSSFLVPGAPLKLNGLDKNVVNEIDSALTEDFEKEDVLRKMFWKARASARKELKEQLSVFRDKRAAGLGGIFGPSDAELKTCEHNRNKELQVIDDLLVPVLDSLSEDLDNATDRSLTIASAIATIMNKNFNCQSQAARNVIEKCPNFVSKEKKSKIFARTKKSLQVNGHHFELKQYFQVTYCNQSQQMIWGIGPQGYHCTNCGFDVHKKHVQKVEETCVVGPQKQKQDRRSRGGVIGRMFSETNIAGRKQSNAVSPSQNKDPTFRSYDESSSPHSGATEGGPRAPMAPDTPDSSGRTNGLLGMETDPSFSSPSGSTGSVTASPLPQVGESPSKLSSQSERWQNRDQSGTKVGRAQSCKLDKEKGPMVRAGNRERRKHSDPNIPRQTSDVDTDTPQPISNHPSGSSSTSSLSARSSLDSPADFQGDVPSHRSPHVPASSDSTATTSLGSSTSTITQQSFWGQDSDFETEPDPPDWRLSLEQEALSKLKAKERKRQDVINELFHTEKSHVRNLKVLDRLFYQPLRDERLLPPEFLETLFPNLDEVLGVHTRYNLKMKERVKQGFPIGDIGEILSEMFDGPNGDKLIRVGAEFTQNQKFTIEALKEHRRRDHKLDTFLSEQERRPECRRLQLQSILPVEHQRLVKYPLLLEQLAKQCDKDVNSEEHETVKRLCDRTREILESIDKQVAEAQNVQRLAEIQRNLDTSGLDKMADNPNCSSICAEYRNIDLTKHRLIYDGPITLKLGDTRRFKTIDLHVVLLEDCIMLLQKQDDKYLLKFHTSTTGNAVTGQGDSRKFFHSPVIKFSTMLVRPVATNKRAFYLLNTTQNGPQIYELVASSTADRAQWFRHITEASNAYKSRETRRGGYRDQNGLNEASGGGADKKDSCDLLSVPGSEKSLHPAGRSQSFHESSSSNREQPPERQPSSPPEDRLTGELDSFAKKTGDDSSGSRDLTSPGPRKRLQRVEILKIAEPCPLIDPSQVVVTQGEVLVADPVLTPIEKLRRKDDEVARALEEKQRLIAEILHIPSEDFETIVDIASSSDSEKDAREVLLAALAQAKSLSDLVNESLSLSEEDVLASASAPDRPASPSMRTRRIPGPPTEKLVNISTNMNQHLTTLLAIIQDRDEERDRLRRELQRSQDQIHAFLAQPTTNAALSAGSRPASFISESSGPELSSEREDDAPRDAPTSETADEAVEAKDETTVPTGECLEEEAGDTDSQCTDVPPSVEEAPPPEAKEDCSSQPKDDSSKEDSSPQDTSSPETEQQTEPEET